MANKRKEPVPQQYIKQPYPLSTLASDLSLVQTHILVEMMDSVSVKVGQMFDQGGSRLLFKDEDFQDGVAHIDVDFRSLTNRPDSYRDIESVALKMMSAQMEFTENKADGLTKIVINAFESVEIPMEGNRRKGIIRFRLTRNQASSLFDFTRYSKYLKSVARNTNSVYTARIYMLITAWRKFGVWNADYQELRKNLGCNVFNKDTKQWEMKKYAEYRQFKRRVLRTAEDELKQLAENGAVDCYFDFKEVYDAGRVTAQPDRITFTIHTTEMGQLEDKRQSEAHHFYELQAEIQELFGLTDRETHQILQHIDDDVVEQFTIRVREIARSIKKQGDKIKNPKAYALKSLNEAVMEFTPELVEVKEGHETGAETRTTGTKGTAATGTGTLPFEEVPTATLPVTDSERKKWNTLVEKLATEPRMRIALEGIQLRKDADGLYISMPTQTFAEAFADEIGKITKKSKLKARVG